MFQADETPLEWGRGLKVRVNRADGPLRYSAAASLWQHDQEFRSFFIALLARAPWSAFRWETPPVTASTVHRDFEFVLLDSPGIDLPPDPTDFSELFAGAQGQDVISFPNLGHDALLVAPLPLGPHQAYSHLASFTRLAPEEQNHALWAAVGRTFEQQVGEDPFWLSTAGGGVAWLHVRFDSWPKYYGYGPYRTAP